MRLGMAVQPELVPGYEIVAEVIKDRTLRAVLLGIFGCSTSSASRSATP